MLRKYLSFTLAIILLQITAGLALSSTKAEKDAARLARVKAEVAKRGTGEKARIRVKMLDGTTIKGFIEQAGADNFVLRESETFAPKTIAYIEVAKIAGKEWSTSQKILFGLAVLAVVSVVLFPHNTD
ncbi:MAG TPA: hypothetical protein VLM38_22690 [Blastocatellia bacterium]|nr:hypothetical protein [Blastocatellia bacterium]